MLELKMFVAYYFCLDFANMEIGDTHLTPFRHMKFAHSHTYTLELCT
jgi:hypothetical protein